MAREIRTVGKQRKTPAAKAKATHSAIGLKAGGEVELGWNADPFEAEVAEL